MIKIAFLDRDGVINYDKGYVGLWKDFQFIEGAIDALRLLQENHYEIVIITNQSGIARGYYTEEDFLKLSSKLTSYLDHFQIKILEIMYCPHHPDSKIEKYSLDCKCRKPKTGMIESIFEKYDVDLANSILVGDKTSDIQAGISSNIPNLFLIGSGIDLEACILDFNSQYDNLYDLVKHEIVKKNV